MKKKEVEDVLGGAGAWDNVDKTDGMPSETNWLLWQSLTLQFRAAQCPNEKCDGSQAFFYQMQIRSADEPMTSFYKVSHERARGYFACF